MLKSLVTGAILAVFLLSAPSASAEYNVTVFEVPEGAGPHDVAPAPGVLIWYTAQDQGALGILDPQTGETRHVPLGEGSAPHGVIAGPDGNAWITDSGLNAIVRYNPTNDDVTVWPLPDSAGHANLNTAAFDGDGRIWFTGQRGIHGVLSPETGDMEVWKSPRGRGPYGIASTPDGEVWYVSLAGNYLGQIDRSDGDVKVIEPPTQNQGARRVWSDSKGNLWISEWNSGQLSRYTPATGEWKTWPLPDTGARAYAVYVDERDHVWVSDFASNATLVFDPAEESWSSIPGSASGAGVRQILGRPGEVWLPESGLDRLMRVTFDDKGGL